MALRWCASDNCCIASPDVIRALFSCATMPVDPPPLVTEDSAAAALARKRLAKGKHLSLNLPRFPSLKVWRTKSPREEPAALRVSDDTAEIDLGNLIEDSNNQNSYKWAVIYENQRGFVLASFLSGTSILISSPVSQNHHFFYTVLLSLYVIPT